MLTLCFRTIASKLAKVGVPAIVTLIVVTGALPAKQGPSPSPATLRALVEPIYRCNQSNCSDPMNSYLNLPYSAAMRALMKRVARAEKQGEECIDADPITASNGGAGIGEDFRIVDEYTTKNRASLTVVLLPGGNNVIATEITKRDGKALVAPERSITWYFVRENGHWLVDDILNVATIEGAYTLLSLRARLGFCE